jgi:dephospho-CoA kinase
MLKVGLTGGVASGKSAVAGLLAAHGAAVRDADRVVEELYRPGAPGAAAVAGLFGAGALAADGGVDRATLADLVLADPDRRRTLEAAIHPLVRGELARWTEALERAKQAPAVAVVEAALLVETGAWRAYHRLVVVTAPAVLRRARALAAGWSAERVDRVIAAQLAEAERAAVADYLIRNDGDPAALARRVGELWPRLLDDAAALRRGETLDHT